MSIPKYELLVEFLCDLTENRLAFSHIGPFSLSPICVRQLEFILSHVSFLLKDICSREESLFAQNSQAYAPYNCKSLLFSVFLLCEKDISNGTVRCVCEAIQACEHASTSKGATKLCAFSLVKQMFHLGEIEAFTGPAPKNASESVLSSILQYSSS